MAKYLKVLVFLVCSYAFSALAINKLERQVIESPLFVKGYVTSVDSSFIHVEATHWGGLKSNHSNQFKIELVGDLKITQGEYVLFFIKMKNESYALSKGILSAYSIKKVGITEYMINKSKLLNPKDAQFETKAFYGFFSKHSNSELVQRKENYESRLVKNRSLMRRKAASKGRSIASVGNSIPSEKRNSVVWTLLFMCLLSISFQRFQKKN